MASAGKEGIMSKLHNRTGRSLFETLETRKLLAGNVTAAVDGNGVLQIVGDNKSNQINVNFDGANLIITGLNGTKVNGAASASIPPFIPGGVNVDMGNGDDLVDWNETTIPPHGIVILAPVTIDTGNGDDTVNLKNWGFADAVKVSTGNGGDNVVVQNSDFGSTVLISTGNGPDSVAFSGTNGGPGSITVDGGNGPDAVTGIASLSGPTLTTIDVETVA
jgi:hypothetical protein